MTEKEANDFFKERAKELNDAYNTLCDMKVLPLIRGIKDIRSITYSDLRKEIGCRVGWCCFSFSEGERLFREAIPIVQRVKKIARETKGVTLRSHLGKVYFYKKDFPAFIARQNAILL